MKSTASICLLTSLTLLLAGPTLADPCNEFFQVSSSPHGATLGLNNDGNNYGQGQSFDLNCGARLESVAFKIFWGNDVGAVRSLAYGDSIYMSILTLDGEEVIRRGYMLDTSIGNRTVTHYLTGDNVLLPAATYIAAIWTNAPACGGLSSYNADVVDGIRYQTGTPQDWASWTTLSGELYHTIVVDSDVTPNTSLQWSSLKAVYR